MYSASVCQRQTLFLTLGIRKSSDGVFFKPGATQSAVALESPGAYDKLLHVGSLTLI